MKITGETFFVDTNVLVSVTDRGRAHHARALHLLEALPATGGHLVWNGQVLREYLVVATRPVEVNGMGLPAGRALENVRAFRERLHLLSEEPAVAASLEVLVGRYGLSGRRIHDANIVATMMVHGIEICLSDNPADFAEFREIQVVGSDFGGRQL